MSNIIVVGCGRVGSQLANMLSDNGSNVCVID
ncbi:MAG: NAD-binding protein, partial [Berryella intestinalis]|nr:NAD-binding protein [Berryella intestinalis]